MPSPGASGAGRGAAVAARRRPPRSQAFVTCPRLQLAAARPAAVAASANPILAESEWEFPGAIAATAANRELISEKLSWLDSQQNSMTQKVRCSLAHLCWA